MTVFGALRHGGQVEDAVLASFTRWLPDYLAEVARQEGLSGPLGPPRSSELAADVTKWPESQLPCLLVVSPGTIGDPLKQGDGRWRVRFRLNVTVIDSAASERDTRRLGQLYGAVVRGVLLQQRKLSDTVSVVGWGGEGYDQVPQQNRRTLGFALNAFTVELKDVIAEAGPVDPSADPLDPPPDWPSVVTVDVKTQPRS